MSPASPRTCCAALQKWIDMAEENPLIRNPAKEILWRGAGFSMYREDVDDH